MRCVDGLRDARVLLELSDAWSAACMCPAYCVAAFAAGPDEIRGSGPNQAVALEAPRILLVVPISSNDRRVINSFSADAPRAFSAKEAANVRLMLFYMFRHASGSPRRCAPSCWQAPRLRA